MVLVVPVGLVILAARVAPIDRADPAARVIMADLAGRATTADPVTAAQEVPEDPADPADPDGQATTADLMTAAGTGAHRPQICPGVGWTRAGSTTSRSTTTAGG